MFHCKSDVVVHSAHCLYVSAHSLGQFVPGTRTIRPDEPGLWYWVLVLVVLDLYLSIIFKYLYWYWYLEPKYWYLYWYLRLKYWYLYWYLND